ncbi:unnamed protein product [Spirodela intermedia]|uniref:Uncharacterized protein n=1 Tax=Spirodela intermedia TaxID=51605 RepID=A0A7I8IYJ0_SPIIN|nr:unnamed protein product [Spirodela intermedia]CAA6662869.1 unnamed protein product [Spirodela intermedia]
MQITKMGIWHALKSKLELIILEHDKFSL